MEREEVGTGIGWQDGNGGRVERRKVGGRWDEGGREQKDVIRITLFSLHKTCSSKRHSFICVLKYPLSNFLKTKDRS